MALQDFRQQEQAVELLQRSLERGRLGHGYLFTGHAVDELESLARALAKTLNCLQPVRAANGLAVDSCDGCASCRKIDHGNHADVHWVRPESRTRIIAIDQVRELSREMQLKATEAEYKVAVVVEADRLKTEAANSFLKTLEEPPGRSVIILLTTAPERLLETIISRCLRLTFAGGGGVRVGESDLAWLASFAGVAAGSRKSLIARYRLLDQLLQRLRGVREEVAAALTARSPLERYEDAEKETKERWEAELDAAVEAGYRRRRGEILSALQWWLRDVWLHSLSTAGVKTDALLNFPALSATGTVGARVSPELAVDNLRVVEQMQRWLNTNVQADLAIEVGLLKLNL